MNGFLVLTRHLMDDFPLSLHSTFAEAERAASRIDPDNPGPVCELFGFGGSSASGVDVVEFRDGVPVKVTHVRDFEDEPVEPVGD